MWPLGPDLALIWTLSLSSIFSMRSSTTLLQSGAYDNDPASLRSNAIENIFDAKPSVYGQDSYKDTPLRAAFADVALHFNHFIKRGAQKLNMEDFLMFFVRNAALLGANSQPGFDFGFMLCSGLFLVQVKNDPRYSDQNSDHLFDLMDPVSLGIIALDVPIIRVVMALAGRKPALKCRSSQTKGAFTAFDIYASGLHRDVYGVIGKEIGAWADILQASHGGWEQIYKDRFVPSASELKKTMTPLAGDEPVFRSWYHLMDEMDTDPSGV